MAQPNWTEVNKGNEREERCDKDDDEVEEHKHRSEQDNGKKEKTEETAVDKPGIIFLLEKACLEVAKIETTYQLLNSYDHDFIDSYRPDITHQALLTILDSPVNKAGRLKAIYVSTDKGVLFEVKPHAHIPRTYKRFAGLMVQLLRKLSITVRGEKLLQVIKNPVTDHLPTNSRKIGFSLHSDNLVNMQKLCNENTDTVFVLGAMEHESLAQRDYMDDFVRISRYPLSTSYCISRVCEALSKTEEDNEEKEIIEEGAAVNFYDQTAVDIDGRLPKVLPDKKPGIVFVIEKASLEAAKVGKTYQLLNSSDHANFLRTSNRNPADYRPDITHQALLMILDSPVNKAGRLKAVYVRTQTGVLFEVKTHASLPRVYKRFTEVMLQLLQSLIVTEFGLEKLRVIKNPVTDYLPVNSRKIGLSFSSDNMMVNMQNQYLANVCKDRDTVFVVGAMAAHGKIDCQYIDEYVATYPLSAAYCISRICETLSRMWNIK